MWGKAEEKKQQKGRNRRRLGKKEDKFRKTDRAQGLV